MTNSEHSDPVDAALALREQGRLEEALELLPAKGGASCDRTRIARGDCLLRLKRFKEALACFELCESDAAREPAMFGRAAALQLLRRFDEAEEVYLRLLALNPKAEEALSNLIAMSMEVFDLTRVLRYSRQLFEINDQSQAALQGLVLAALERHEYSDAAGYFARLMEHHAEITISREPDDGSIKYRVSREAIELMNFHGRQEFP